MRIASLVSMDTKSNPNLSKDANQEILGAIAIVREELAEAIVKQRKGEFTFMEVEEIGTRLFNLYSCLKADKIVTKSECTDTRRKAA